ncbi:hypothetical protein ABT115_02245 [Streptomyces sp. NPDC001832]|uniref:hypothetical protein n=1 Tax=Streptomyces sp. NPDC001832 TaxID=3154527 RepID=UPI003317C3ED
MAFDGFAASQGSRSVRLSGAAVCVARRPGRILFMLSTALLVAMTSSYVFFKDSGPLPADGFPEENKKRGERVSF